MCFGVAGWWWVAALSLLLVVVRRWWLVAAVSALLAGLAVGSIAVRSVPRYEPGTTYELTIRLTEAPRISHGQWGDAWFATAEVVAGGPPAIVTVRGGTVIPLRTGDRLTGRMRVSAPTRPGQAASVWVQGSPAVATAAGIPAQVRDRMRVVAGADDAGWLLSGMTLGLDQGLSEQSQAAMRQSGLTHLTAVSGANCAILIGLVWWLAGWLRVPRLPRSALCIAVLMAFVAVVGPEPSVLRASVMAVLALLAGLVGGRKAAAHLLQVCVIGLLLVDPWLAFSVGFMLSIAATAGLIGLIDRGLLAAAVAAQVATMPILLAIGGSVGLQSVLANLLVTPLAAAIPVLGLTSLLVAPVAVLGRWGCQAVLTVAHWEVFGPLPWVGGSAGVVLAAVVCAAVFAVGRRHIAITAAVLIGAVSLTVRLSDRWPPPDWWLVACDVGQGDGFVVRDGEATIVVDVGPDPRLMDTCLDRLGVTSINLLVLTHFHADHVAGLDGVVGGRHIAQVWVSPCHDPPETFQQVLPDLAGLPVVTPTPGTQAQVGDMRLSVLWPQRIITSGSVPNNASITFYLSTGHGTVAFFGDVEEEAQQAITAQGVPLQADVAKVPHHGSSGFDADLPGLVSPEVALIGVGENSFGHPTPEAISAWQAVGAQVYTTQDNGDVALTDSAVVPRGPREEGR